MRRGEFGGQTGEFPFSRFPAVFWRERELTRLTPDSCRGHGIYL